MTGHDKSGSGPVTTSPVPSRWINRPVLTGPGPGLIVNEKKIDRSSSRFTLEEGKKPDWTRPHSSTYGTFFSHCFLFY